MTEEIWLPVVGWPAYEVSDLGRVRSAHRRQVHVLRGSKAGDGYRKVILANGIDPHRHVYVHRLVLETFVGACPDGMEACHANALREDNRLSNLRWDTPTENNYDIRRVGNHFGANKTHCPRGHSLTAPNLVLGELRRSGGRKCRACNQARAILQRRVGDLQEISDQRYALIIESEAA